jgi:transketolase
MEMSFLGRRIIFMTDHQLQLKAVALRRAMLHLILNAGAGHTGGGLSCMDILNILYIRVLNVSPQTFTNPTRNRYVNNGIGSGLSIIDLA